jgi:asparagine synthase (glutamine-hydrolysing)
MAAMLSHRGPDHQGIWANESLGLGHARLVVLDPSPAANQPMTDEATRAVIVFNGEIYNHRELRAELEAVGLVFRSRSDTEVVLQGYLHWGKAVFARLNGMFALAIYDRERQTLVLARDRIGKKPLYYYDGAGVFVFASEIKAILLDPDVVRRPNLGAIHDYLTLQYTPCPETAFQGIRRLPPAHVMEVWPDGRTVQDCYWRLPHPSLARPRPQAELVREFLSLLENAVRMRMVADVPVGALLSGGVDSSSVVALMAGMSGRPIKTFSVGFDQPGYDETEYAERVAGRYATDHHVLRLGPDCLDILPRLAWHYGEPFADPSAIATFLVSDFARREVGVVLTGDGGDESMLGYPRYLQALDWGKRDARSRLAGLVRRILPSGVLQSGLGRKIAYLAATGDLRPSRRYAPSIMYFMENEKFDAYGDALRPLLGRSTLDRIEPYFAGIASAAAGAAWADIHTYLPDDLLVKVDVASMAFGLEARSPLLDHTLMEWAAALPAEQKMWGGQTKSLFKQAVAGLLPHDLLHRPKMGFGVPVERWLTGAMAPLVDDLLRDGRFRARGLIKPAWIDWALEANSSGQAVLWHRIWALMMLELWYRTWID